MKKVFQITLDSDEVVLISALLAVVSDIMCSGNIDMASMKWIVLSTHIIGQDRYGKLTEKFTKAMDEVVADDAESKSEK